MVAALIFAPSLLGGSAARLLAQALGEDLDGRIELDSVDLAWDRSQVLRGLRLYDPDGVEILAGSVSVPGLLHWDHPVGPLSIGLEISEIELRRDVDGVTGLARALGSGGVPWPAASLTGDFGGLSLEEGLEQDRPYILDWNVDRMRITDDRRPDFVLRAEGLEGSVRYSARGAIEIRAAGAVRLDDVEGRFRLHWTQSPDGVRQGHFEATDIPSRAARELSAGLLDLPMWCGERLSCTLDQSGADDDDADRVQLDVQGQAGKLTYEGILKAGRLELGPEGSLKLESRLSQACVDTMGQGWLALRPLGAVTWSAEATEFSWPSPWGDDQGGAPSYRWQGQVHGELGLQGADDRLAVRLSDANFALERTPSETLAFHATGGLREGTASDPALEASDALGAQFSLDLEGASGPALPIGRAGDHYVFKGEGLPAAIVDALVDGNGLLTEALGGNVDLGLSGPAFEARDSVHMLELDSPNLVLIDTPVQDGIVSLNTQPERPIQVPLSLRICEAILGPALPILQAIEPVGDSLRIMADDLQLELDQGVLRYHSGELHLDPDEFVARLHPGLGGLFGPEEDQAVRSMRLLPVRIRFDGDILHYLDLDLTLAGEDCDLSGGSFDRARMEVNFPLNATLRVAAHKLQLPSDARAVLEDSDYTVDMQIVGPLGKPDLRFSAEVIADLMNGGVRQLLNDAPLGLDLLENWLGNLLRAGD